MVLYYTQLVGILYSTQLVGRLGSDGFWKQDYGWGPGNLTLEAALLAHAEGVLGSVALKSKHSTHTGANGNIGNTGLGGLGGWEVGCGGGSDMGGTFWVAGLGERRRLAAGTSSRSPSKK